MGKLIAIVAIIGCCFIGYAIASSVSTTDGQNYSVTNDGGFMTSMTNSDIMQQLSIAAGQVHQLSEQLLTANEALTIWQGVEADAMNAASQKGYTNAVCSTNTQCWSGSCANSVCQ